MASQHEQQGSETPRGQSSPHIDTSRSDLHLSFPTTIALIDDSAHIPPLSTSWVDTHRSDYFLDTPVATRPRSMSNPTETGRYIPVEISQNSGLADVSADDAVENTGDVSRSRTQYIRRRKKKPHARNASFKVMSRGEDELPPDWTVGLELFEGQQAPLVVRPEGSDSRGRGNDGLASHPSDASRIARNATSVIRHWRNVMSSSKLPRQEQDAERGEVGAPVSPPSTQLPSESSNISRVRTIRVPPSESQGVSTQFTMSPTTTNGPLEPMSPISIGPDHPREGASQFLESSSLPNRSSGTRRHSRSRSNSSASSSSDDGAETPRPVHENRLKRFVRLWKEEVPKLSTLQRNILKCAIAYFIGSLFTFIPFLSNLVARLGSLGRPGGNPYRTAHLVATVSVYYNPAKTAGGMFEADVFCLMGVLFTTLVTCGSVVSSLLVDSGIGLEWLGDFVIFVWLAVSIMIISWMKVWINKASFNSAASMMCIIIFIVVVKEGGFATLLQVLVSVAFGVTIANVVCFILWSQSATENLQRDMITSLDSYATLLDMLTSSFILDPRSKDRVRLIRAVEAHQAGFTSLKRNLDEARSEWILNPPDAPPGKRSVGQQKLSDLYGEAVDSLNRLAQHLAGLRSGTKLQRDLTMVFGRRKLQDKLKRDADRMAAGMFKVSEVTDDEEPLLKVNKVDDDEIALDAAAAVFGTIVDDVGPPMVALTEACTGTLKSMRTVLIQDRQREKHANSWTGATHSHDAHDFSELSHKIERALFLFDSTSNQALMRLYRRSAMTTDNESMHSTKLHQEDDETMFLTYFFIFTLQEFARELVSLVEVMGKLHQAQENALAYRGLLGWLRRVFGIRGKKTAYNSTRNTAPNYGSITSSAVGKQASRPGIRKRFSNLVPIEPSRTRLAFPRTRAHAPNTYHTPAPSSLSRRGRLKQRIWAILHKLKDGDVRYSVKVGVSTAILAIPAFIDATRPMFVLWRGEWALISFFVVMGQTIGATNFLALHRIMGTLLGAGVATLAFTWLSDYPILLAIFGFIFSLPCFYYIVSKPEYATSGRFVLLSYNLTALFCYNSRAEDVSVFEVAIHRSIAVTTGVVFALIVSRTWWPAEARRELGVELSDFLLNLGWIYNRLVLTYSVPPEVLAQSAGSELGITLPILGSTAALVDGYIERPDERTGLLGAALATGLNSSIRDFMAMELHLQIKLIHLQKLLSQCAHEPRLKGPFPTALYRSILISLQIILDLFHSMRCVTTREEWYTSIRRDFVIPVNKQRREMVGNVILFFSVLSSAFQLKKPIPPYLPPAERSRQSLVSALKRLEIVRERKVQSSRQLLYFAYALMMSKY